MWETVAGHHASQAASAVDPTRETWAKAVTLVLLDHTANAVPPRQVTVVRFSVDIDSTHHFPAGRPPAPDEILALAGAWKAEGGTDYWPPLHNALTLIADARHHPRQDGAADVVFLTDGEHHGHTAWLKTFRARKAELGFRVFGVAIAGQPSPELTAISDTVHTIDDLTDPSDARALFRL
ncbi:vWA domain-containing protein [Actinomadura fibrosa]|uniref:VWA domain-containing protein n=2 Tax=Actinomadura fibrosa TaxID=111802 RepID=A0ABW2XP48_9ACTN